MKSKYLSRDLPFFNLLDTTLFISSALFPSFVILLLKSNACFEVWSEVFLQTWISFALIYFHVAILSSNVHFLRASSNTSLSASMDHPHTTTVIFLPWNPASAYSFNLFIVFVQTIQYKQMTTCIPVWLFYYFCLSSCLLYVYYCFLLLIQRQYNLFISEFNITLFQHEMPKKNCMII